jgi:hypothetical protein
MNGLNVTGLLMSTGGSLVFIWAEWKERRERANAEKPASYALKDLRNAKKELVRYEASLREIDQAGVDLTDLTQEDRNAIAESQARMEAEVQRRTNPYRDAVDRAQARWDALTEPDLGEVDLRGLPPDLQIRGLALLAVGFVFQLAGEVFGP